MDITIDLKELDYQIKSVLESNMQEEAKEGLHNLLGEIKDEAEENKEMDIRLSVRGLCRSINTDSGITENEAEQLAISCYERGVEEANKRNIQVEIEVKK